MAIVGEGRYLRLVCDSGRAFPPGTTGHTGSPSMFTSEDPYATDKCIQKARGAGWTIGRKGRTICPKCNSGSPHYVQEERRRQMVERASPWMKEDARR